MKHVEKALQLAREIDRRHIEMKHGFFTVLRSSNGNLTGERLKSGGTGYYLHRTSQQDGRTIPETSGVIANSDKEAVSYLRGYLDALALLQNTK